jgi:hypothetical protein
MEDVMLVGKGSARLKLVMTLCMVLAGGAVSMGTSCITAPKKAGSGNTGGSSSAGTGTINGTIDSLGDSAPIGAGVTVTATDSATGATFVGTTAANGTYSISDVPSGAGSLLLSNLPSGCTVPGVLTYNETSGGTLTYNTTVDCPIQIP